MFLDQPNACGAIQTHAGSKLTGPFQILDAPANGHPRTILAISCVENANGFTLRFDSNANFSQVPLTGFVAQGIFIPPFSTMVFTWPNLPQTAVCLVPVNGASAYSCFVGEE